jgi:hypothetical protein
VTNALRVGWLAIAVLPQSLSASNGASGASTVGFWLAWGIWVIVALAVLVPHPLSLVTARLLAPLLALHTGATVLEESTLQWSTVIALLLMITVSATAFSARYGSVHAQAAAYGHERRHLLRPPMAVLASLALVWLVVAALGAVAMRGEQLAVSLSATALFIALAGFMLRRALVLSRRWLVFVPAGIAVHDPLILRDTFMVRNHDVRALRDAASNTEAFDVTGTTWGTPLELVLSHPHDVSLSQFGARLTGTLDRLHVTALLVAPSRPHIALADLSR